MVLVIIQGLALRKLPFSPHTFEAKLKATLPIIQHQNMSEGLKGLEFKKGNL